MVPRGRVGRGAYGRHGGRHAQDLHLLPTRRREYAAGALGRELRDHFGEEQVFRDKEDIGGGEAWKGKVLDAIDGASALLILIGPRWLDAQDAAGGRRIDHPDDPIRMELHDGIRDGAAIIPVLLENATMPRAEDLPPDLAPLAEYNALKLHDSDWRYNMERILRTLEKAGFKPLPGRTAGQAGTHDAPPTASRWSGKVIAGGVLVLVTLLGLAGGELDRDAHIGAAFLSAAALVAALLGWRETSSGRAKGRGLAITVTTLSVIALLAALGGLQEEPAVNVGGQPPPVVAGPAGQPEPAPPAPSAEQPAARVAQTTPAPPPAAAVQPPAGTGGSGPLPPAAPVAVREVSPAAPSVPDISGRWTDDEDAVYEFTQEGSAVHMFGMSTEGLAVQGVGTLTGRQLRMRLSLAGLITLQVTLDVSPDGRHLRGTMTGPDGSETVELRRAAF